MRDTGYVKVEIDHDNLAILLGYAYRGEAAQGGECRNNRDEHCAMCQALTEAEQALDPDDREDPNWWTPALNERVRKLWRKVRYRR